MSKTTVDWSYAGRNNWFSVAMPQEQLLFQSHQKATKLYTNFDEAAAYNAQCIYTDWGNKPLYLMLSGGIDSERVANSFYEQNIPFTPIIVDLGDVNYPEKWYADYWCNKRGIRPIVLTFTPEELLRKVIKPYLRILPKYTRDYTTTIYLYLADYVEQLGGVCISGLADPNWDLERQQFFCDYVDFPLTIHRNGKHPAGFFLYTPEIALSYVNQFDCTLDEQYNKIQFYNVGVRVKYSYFIPFLNVSTEFMNIKRMREKDKPEPIPHWYGNKESLIGQLI